MDSAACSIPPRGLEAILWDDWHVIAEVTTVACRGRLRTVLFGRPLIVASGPAGIAVEYAGRGGAVTSDVRYGYVWACLGSPARAIVDFPEAREDDRYVASAGSLGIAVSGLRAIENFLDLAHLPFVHAGTLGDPSDAAVREYAVTADETGVRVSDVHAYQPVASPTATEEMVVDYEYRVLRPYTATLYKTNPVQRSRRDALALMVQPVDEEHCVLHMLDLYLRDGDPNESAREFTRAVQSQDKPVLENQRPRRLPLYPRAELPVRSDAASLAYRRWLVALGVRYGAIAADAS